MNRTALSVLLAVPPLFGSAAFGCVGDDLLAGPSSMSDGGSLDAQGALLPDGGGPTVDGGTDDAQVTPPPYVPSAGSFVKASNAEAYDFFGDAVALSADGSTMVVGASGERSGATGPGASQTDNAKERAGAAYVFVKSREGVWSQQAYLKPSNTIANGYFGDAVAISADGNRIAVGAKGDGSVYVFHRSASAPFWTQIPSVAIKPSNAAGSNASFGYGLALSGDGNTLAIGAIAENGSATGVSTGNGGASTTGYDFAGAVYIWAYSGGSWSQTHYIKPSDTEPGGRFGWSLALSGSGSTLAVGAIGEASPGTGIRASASTDTGAAFSGAVYLFEKTTTWNQTTFIKAKTPGPALVSGSGSRSPEAARRSSSAPTKSRAARRASTRPRRGTKTRPRATEAPRMSSRRGPTAGPRAPT